MKKSGCVPFELRWDFFYVFFFFFVTGITKVTSRCRTYSLVAITYLCRDNHEIFQNGYFLHDIIFKPRRVRDKKLIIAKNRYVLWNKNESISAEIIQIRVLKNRYFKSNGMIHLEIFSEKKKPLTLMRSFVPYSIMYYTMSILTFFFIKTTIR